MNCSQCQNRLLSHPELDAVPAEVEAHLADCPACRQWLLRLRQIEANVPLLPVSTSERKHQFKQDFLEGKIPAPVTLPIRRPWSPRRRLAVALAAACVVIACGILLTVWLAGSGGPDEPLAKGKPDPADSKPVPTTLADKLLDVDLRLAQADTPRQRVEDLARLAENLHGETRSLVSVAAPGELNTLAQLYDKVVKEGIIARARRLPPAERRQALRDVRTQLAEQKRQAEELAQKAAPAQATPLLLIAAAARTGDRQLRALMEEVTP
jgi:hypothetical protein